MTPENMDIRQQQYDTITHYAFCLEKLAGAFHRTGNTHVSDELFHISRQLTDAVKVMRDIDGKDLTDLLRQTHEASENMLNACFAGAAIAVRDRPRDANGEYLDGTERLEAERKEQK